MRGMDANTGKALDGEAHLAQSIADILVTPIGSRVMRRDYGSMLFELIDQPLNAATRLLVFAASALAIRRWEPRFVPKRFTLDLTEAAQGKATLNIEGDRTDLPTPRTGVLLSIPLLTGQSPALS